jgi:hypothetical protein
VTFPNGAAAVSCLNCSDGDRRVAAASRQKIRGLWEEYAALRILNVGDTVTVYQEAPASDGGIWGKIGDGAWVNLKYVER